MKKITTAEQFCHDILDSTIKRAKPLVNIVMALGSATTARNPTQLSLSPFFQYHYSIIGKVMEDLGQQLEAEDNEELKSEIRQLFFEHLPRSTNPSVYNLSTDFTTIRKAESPTLAERGFVNVPNVRIYGNKPIDIGYYISCINLHLYDSAHPNSWSIPLDNQRMAVDADKTKVAAGQLATIIGDKKLPFAQSDKVVHTSDSGFTIPEFIAPLIDEFDNLLLISRLRYGMKVYKPYTGLQKDKGRDKVYEDDPYYLQIQSERIFTNRTTKEKYIKEQRPIFELPCDEEIIYEATTRKGRPIFMCLFRWDNLLLRGKKGYKMADKPFDLVGIRLVDANTGACLFKRDMFVGIWGKQRQSHPTPQIQTDYRHRYDIEPHNRFSKQQLLADKYQTSNVKSLDAWLYTVMLTFWLLYFSATDTQTCVQPWEKYLPEVKRAENSNDRMSVAHARKGAAGLFHTFDLRPFKPQESKNGRGREKGVSLPKKTRHRPTRKLKNKQNHKQHIEQIE